MRHTLACAALAAACALLPASADPPADVTPTPYEATVFKDGHCLYRARAATRPVDGKVALVGLAPPTMGGLWFECETAGARIASIRAVEIERAKTTPCGSLVDLARANAGRSARVSEQTGDKIVEHTGTLVAVKSADPAAPAFVGLRTATGTRYVTAARLVGLEIEGEVATEATAPSKETRWEIALAADKDAALPAEVSLAVTGLVRGVRWIPEYRLERTADTVRLRFQATVIDDVLDLSGVTLRLVAGVPRFPLADADSPLWIAGERAVLSSHFDHFRAGPESGYDQRRVNRRMLGQQLASQSYSNAFQNDPDNGAGSAGGTSVDPARLVDATTASAGDLHVYERTGVTLAKGQRASFLMADATLACRDLYRWTLRAVPPQPMWQHVGEDEATRLHKDIEGARVEHLLALANGSGMPLSSGPALLFDGGRVLGQNILRYAAPGGTVELPVTDAVDIANGREEREISRDHNVRLREPDVNYTRVTLEGELKLVNRKKTAVVVQVVRHVFGEATAAGDDGKIRQTNLIERAGDSGLSGPLNWPWWWAGVNPVSTIEWSVELAPGQERRLSYRWQYHFR